MLGQTFNPAKLGQNNLVLGLSLYDPVLSGKNDPNWVVFDPAFLECRKNDLKSNRLKCMWFVKIRCHVYFLTTKALLTKQILDKYAKNLSSVCVKLSALVFCFFCVFFILTDESDKHFYFHHAVYKLCPWQGAAFQGKTTLLRGCVCNLMRTLELNVG